MSTNVSNLATPETGNIRPWSFTISHQVGPLTPETFSNKFTTASSLSGLLLVEVATAPSSLVFFASTLACHKPSSTSMISIPVNHCNSIEKRSGNPLMKAILTVFSRLCPVYLTNPPSHLISVASTSPKSR